MRDTYITLVTVGGCSHFTATACGYCWTFPSSSRLLTKSASSVLAALRGSRGLAPALPVPVPLVDGDSRRSEGRQSLRLLRPCWTAFLNSLRMVVTVSVSNRASRFRRAHVVCQQTARNRCLTGRLPTSWNRRIPSKVLSSSRHINWVDLRLSRRATGVYTTDDMPARDWRDERNARVRGPKSEVQGFRNFEPRTTNFGSRLSHMSYAARATVYL